jgi:histidyl-tRNA synthetase
LEKLTRLRGFQDLLGRDSYLLGLVEQRARAMAERYGFNEIRLPVLERVGLYQHSTGETSDIVEKQMYVFADRDEAQSLLALRPEGTPGVVRAYIEAGLDRSAPEQRFYYSGPMFRRERPQKGRLRQHHQFGVEVLGRTDAACDAELLIMIDDLRRELGLELRFEVNSIGDPNCRPAFREAVYRFGMSHEGEICDDCKRRLKQNPLRLLDCKLDAALAARAPKSIDHLCEPCRKHFEQVKQALAASGVQFVENPHLVRGLDYYTRTTFEVIAQGLGAQNTVVAGGRYDGLVEMLGGAPVGGAGFAMGLERFALALAASEQAEAGLAAAVIALGESAVAAAMTVARELRGRNLRVEMLSPERGLKAMLRRADKIGARYAIIIGEDELARAVVQLRDLRASTQRELPIAEVAAAIGEGDSG